MPSARQVAEAVVFTDNVMRMLIEHGYHVTTLEDGFNCLQQVCTAMDEVERLDASGDF